MAAIRNPAASAPEPPRLTYQQRLDQTKAAILELSRKNMENALRTLRAWMKEGERKQS